MYFFFLFLFPLFAQYSAKGKEGTAGREDLYAIFSQVFQCKNKILDLLIGLFKNIKIKMFRAYKNIKFGYQV